ncbi:hypothetical protein Taro_040106 [Colocasia esculenta]|uniref:Uncharacterized protein n=1 Tax=Colocasia esculenta TaxID=4460 RepID=A0A843WKU6_COLES|nr:hypothetical protein [Colocasia esculenta]
MARHVATSEEVSARSGRDRIAVAVRFRVMTWLLSRRLARSQQGLSRCPSPSRWCRDGLGGCDSTCVASGVSVGPVVCRRVPQGRPCP